VLEPSATDSMDGTEAYGPDRDRAFIPRSVVYMTACRVRKWCNREHRRVPSGMGYYVRERDPMKSTNAGTGRRGPTGTRRPWAAPNLGRNPETRRQGSVGLKAPRKVHADGTVGVMWREGTWRCELALVLGYPVLRLCDRDTVELEHEIMPGTIPEVAEVIRRAVLRHISAHVAVRRTKTPLRKN
jgi:hypothetical protein